MEQNQRFFLENTDQVPAYVLPNLNVDNFGHTRRNFRHKFKNLCII